MKLGNALMMLVCAAASVGCGGSDKQSPADQGQSGNAGSTSAGADGAGTSGADSGGESGSAGSGNATTNGSGDFLRASGTINGESFSVECDLDDPVTSSFTSGHYLGHDQCSSSVLSYDAQCLTPEEGIGGVSGNMSVHVSVIEDDHDGMFTNNVNIGGSLDVIHLNYNSSNVVDNTVTVDTLDSMAHVAGSFHGEWSDDGSDEYGDVTGTFDFHCDE